MIEISHLVKRYGTKYAVNDLSVTIGDSGIVGFLGPNGAGKSTTMNIVTGYLSSTSGTVTVNGHNVTDEPAEVKKLIGFLPEQPPIYGDMTVTEYLNFVYDLKKCKLNREKHISEICAQVKIGDVRNRLIRNLSKGYRQRVGIAEALVGNPPIIILDEPTVGLDPKQIIEIRNLIRKLGERHLVILSTHILPEVQAVADRILIINEGRLVADEKTDSVSGLVQKNSRYRVKVIGAQREVLELLASVRGVRRVECVGERDADSLTYLVESDSTVDVRKPIYRAIAEKHMDMIGLEAVSMDLEDIFLSIVDAKTNK